jgi:molybdopterin-biosynthesis enzyme MoeA-like protein
MKIKKLIPGAGLIILGTLLLSVSLDIKPTPGFPEEIMKIVVNSCYECHSGDSQNQIAKTVLDFYKWNEYKTARKVNLLSKMDEAIQDKSMPPRKYIDKNPDRVLTEEQIELFSKWAEEESDKLIQ